MCFTPVIAPCAICKEWGLLTSKWPPIKHASEILKLAEVVHIPLDVTVVCQPEQQKGKKKKKPLALGNKRVDNKAKTAVFRHLECSLLWSTSLLLTTPTEYSEQDMQHAKDQGWTLNYDGQWVTPTGWLFLPCCRFWKAFKNINASCYLGQKYPNSHKNRILGKRTGYISPGGRLELWDLLRNNPS